MKVLSYFFVLVLLFTLIACNNDDAPKADSLITSGTWNATSGFGSFDFTVNSERTNITEIVYNFSNWTCGGVTQSGSISVSSNPGWPITDRVFEIEVDINPDPFDKTPITISGTFAASGDQASGTWEAVVNLTTCSGSWQASPEGE